MIDLWTRKYDQLQAILMGLGIGLVLVAIIFVLGYFVFLSLKPKYRRLKISRKELLCMCE